MELRMEFLYMDNSKTYVHVDPRHDIATTSSYQLTSQQIYYNAGTLRVLVRVDSSLRMKSKNVRVSIAMATSAE